MYYARALSVRIAHIFNKVLQVHKSSEIKPWNFAFLLIQNGLDLLEHSLHRIEACFGYIVTPILNTISNIAPTILNLHHVLYLLAILHPSDGVFQLFKPFVRTRSERAFGPK